MGKFIDLTGRVFGQLTVLYRDDLFINAIGKHRTMWRCKCQCGREKSIRMDALTSGRVKSCGICNNDIAGQRFGRLTVIEQMGTDNVGHLKWKCKCDCGNEITVLATNLIQHYTQSCGCLHSEICSENGDNLVGKKFGKLTAISLYSVSPRKYLCSCECGGIAVVEPRNLKNGHTQSCGCISSLGQEKINSYFVKHHIHFKPEYSMKIDGINGIARYDFALLDNIGNPISLIEYHGRQHYEVVYDWNDSEEMLVERQRKDELKRKWAVDNNIPLYEIPYWEFENIESILSNIIDAEDPDMEESQDVEEEN